MRYLLWGLLGGLLLAGCSGNETLVRKQIEQEARIEQLGQGNLAINTRLSEIGTELQTHQNILKSTTADLEALKSKLQELSHSQGNLGRTVDTLATRLPAVETAKPEPPPQVEPAPSEASPPERQSPPREASPPAPPVPPQEAYQQAFALYSSGRLAEAGTAFQAYLQRYPGSDYAANAQYWLGECYYSQKEFRQALAAFTKVVTDSPHGRKAPDALLKIAYSQVSLGEKATAKKTLQSLVEKFPSSEAAAKARERLRRW
jgi:tol-pal system protein YbgF